MKLLAAHRTRSAEKGRKGCVVSIAGQSEDAVSVETAGSTKKKSNR
jgi:hypothetical protein